MGPCNEFDVFFEFVESIPEAIDKKSHHEPFKSIHHPITCTDKTYPDYIQTIYRRNVNVDRAPPRADLQRLGACQQRSG